MARPLESAPDTFTELQRLDDSARELQRELFARKSKPADLATSLAHFTALARTLQLGLLFEDATRRITSLNETFCALFGITEPDRLIGMDGRAVAELVHTLCADQGHFLSGIERAVTEQVPVTGEEIRLADGRWLEWDYVPVMVGGTCEGHVWSYGDITERQQAEQVLNTILEGTAAVTGEAFFQALVQHLALRLGVPVVLATELAGRSRTRLRVLAMWEHDRLGRNVEYDTWSTLCKAVLAEGSACYPTGVRALFPDDQDLITLEADGYLGYALRDSQGEPIGHLCVITCTPLKIGARVRSIMAIFAARASAELERKRAEGLLQVQKQGLELVASDVPLRDTLDELVRLIEARSVGMLGSILLLDEEGGHLRHGASPNLPDEYTGGIDGVPIGPSSGSCGTAAFLRKPVIVEDIAADPLWKPFRDLALRHGLRACWSTPIVSTDALVLGTFAMYYREPQGPNPHELQLIEHASRLAAIAIERQRAVQALRESEARFREVTESIREVFWLTDPAKQAMLYVSPAYAEIWGRSCKSLYGSPQSWLDAIHGEDRNRVFHATVTQQLSGDYHEVYRIIRPDGSLRWIEDRAFPVKDASGTVVRVAGIAEDITARKPVAEALRRSHEEHEQVSQDLHDDTLQSLYAIGLGLEATRPSITRSSPEGAKGVEGAITQLNAVIHDLRSFIMRMKTPSEPVYRDFARALQGLVGSFTATGVGRIDLRVDSGLGVCCSAEQSVHVLAIAKEALSNSVRHARATHRSVTLRRYRGGLRLEVADDSVGFLPSQQRRSGMGLTNMKARARRLGGRFRTQSKPGQGTRVVLYFLSPSPP